MRDLARGALLDDPSLPVLPVHFLRDGVSVRLFTTIATLGTPRDVTVQGIRIETLFPVDAATDALLRGWVSAIG